MKQARLTLEFVSVTDESVVFFVVGLLIGSTEAEIWNLSIQLKVSLMVSLVRPSALCVEQGPVSAPIKVALSQHSEFKFSRLIRIALRLFTRRRRRETLNWLKSRARARKTP